MRRPDDLTNLVIVVANILVLVVVVAMFGGWVLAGCPASP